MPINTITSYKEFPYTPGVYLFKDDDHHILYIGKATSLRQRVSSYFNKQTSDWKIDALIKEHATIEYIATKTELEAALLEAELIKKYQPKYNILLKSGQPFVYIVFTAPPDQSIKIVRNKNQKGTYFGPFLHKQKARAVYHFLLQTFKLNKCNKKIEHGCLDYHIGSCPGSCMPHFNNNDYLLHLELARKALAGNHQEFISSINKKIQEYNRDLAFEKAHNLSKYLTNMETIFSTIKTHFDCTKFASDIIVATSNTDLLPHDAESASKQLSAMLNLNKIISSIDCFDISHFQSKSMVGSCIRFIDGKPEKNKFRRFKIKTLTEQNDYAALQEIVTRRYAKGDIPDLILIDGGKGQLNAIQKIIPNATCISLAKKEELLFSSIHPQGLKLDVHTPVGQLLISLRDYAHHFAIEYHRLSRKKEW